MSTSTRSNARSISPYQIYFYRSPPTTPTLDTSSTSSTYSTSSTSAASIGNSQSPANYSFFQSQRKFISPFQTYQRTISLNPQLAPTNDQSIHQSNKKADEKPKTSVFKTISTSRSPVSKDHILFRSKSKKSSQQMNKLENIIKNLTKSVAKKSSDNYIEFSKWIQKIKKFCLTIKDIQSLQPGQSINAFLVSNVSSNKYKKHKLYKPSEVFKMNQVNITRQHQNSIRCTITYKHMNVVMNAFDFAVQIENQLIPLINNTVNFKAVNPYDDRVISWTDLLESTPVFFLNFFIVPSSEINHFGLYFQ